MLSELNQDKQDQNLDPLTEGPSFQWGKKIGLLCLAVALIGLFIFFTGDSWGDSKKNNNEELLQEISSLKTRLSNVETQLIHLNQPQLATSTPTIPEDTSHAMPMENLQSLIEEELQEVSTTEIAVAPSHHKETKPTTPKKSSSGTPAKTQKTYTVRKGDTLSKISQQFYGTPKKWRKIVEANKERLGHNQMLKSGMTLTIPKEE